jgi:hypothetical protein
MTNVRSWKFWVIIALALTTLACAGRRERREQAREDRRDRAEQRRMEREARNEPRRTERSRQSGDEAQTAPAAQSSAESSTQAATFQPISTAPTAATGESKVVFMRAANYAFAVAASLFDVTDSGAPKFIGIIRAHQKIVYPVGPGQHTFMVVSEAADFMQATVIGGKTYYALITPRMGAWKARFSFRPVRAGELDGSQFASWDRGTRVVTNTPSTLNWAQANAASVAEKRDRWWPEWSGKPESARASQTLNAEDGR